MPPAVVLLSGGLDSATALAVAIRDGFDPSCLSFRYGQRHHHELACATRIARAFNITRHLTAEIDLRLFGGSALTSDAISVPKSNEPGCSTGGIPVTYVPARNTIFLSFALALAETINAADIYIGVNALDYSGYPDCRPEYIAAFEAMANLATRAGVEGTVRTRIRAPLIGLSKAQIIKLGIGLGVDFAMTSSCYDPDADGRSCGACDACRLRRRGFAEAGVPDPTVYSPG